VRTLAGAGAISQPTGPGESVLKLKPPQCVTRDDIDFFAEALEHALSTGWQLAFRALQTSFSETTKWVGGPPDRPPLGVFLVLPTDTSPGDF
jgi:hypothetical protein